MRSECCSLYKKIVSSSVALTRAILVGVRTFSSPWFVICVYISTASQPIPSTSRSYASPSPEFSAERTKSGSPLLSSFTQLESPSTVVESCMPGAGSYNSSDQSACGLLCHGHHTDIRAETTATIAAAHVAMSPISGAVCCAAVIAIVIDTKVHPKSRFVSFQEGVE